jgi:hypothetical protein
MFLDGLDRRRCCLRDRKGGVGPKSYKDAESAVSRERFGNGYLSDRRKPGCRILLIQTRWHYDDLAGRILPEDYDFRSGPVTARDGEDWFVINLRAIADRVGRSARPQD